MESPCQASTKIDAMLPAALSVDQHAFESTVTNGQSGLYPQFLLFGDSITQQASLTVQPRLQTLYIRRADIVNRGFSGFTTSLALSTLPCFLPPTNPNLSSIQPSIRLATVFFGANDASLPGHAQHVPLPTFVANLRKIAEYSVFSQHGTKIIFITPAPVNEWQLSKPLNRTAANAKKYAHAVRQLGKEMGIPCIDLWTSFMKQATRGSPLYSEIRLEDDGGSRLDGIGHKGINNRFEHDTQALVQPESAELPALPGSLTCPPNKMLSTLLRDGLHFTPDGYDILFNELSTLIQRDIPDCMPANLPFCFKEWRDLLGVVPDTTVAELPNGQIHSPTLPALPVNAQAAGCTEPSNSVAQQEESGWE